MLHVKDMGLKPYQEALAVQKGLHSLRVANEIPDTLIFCEHPPVFTVGRRQSSADWLSDFQQIAGDGIEIVRTDRGGKITYHGPGQIVGYLIFDITTWGVKGFVKMVELACITALSKFGVHAETDRKYPGLWVDFKKILALGFHISKNISYHGFALNVSPDLKHYRHIVPCGIKGRGVTSMKEVLGANLPPMETIKNSFAQALTDSTEEKVRPSFSSKGFMKETFFDSSGRDFNISS